MVPLAVTHPTGLTPSPHFLHPFLLVAPCTQPLQCQRTCKCRRRVTCSRWHNCNRCLCLRFSSLGNRLDGSVFRRSQKRHIAPGVCVIVTDRLRVVFICDPRCSCPVACPVPCQVTCGRSRAVGGRVFAVSVLVASAGAVCADARQEHVSRQLNCVGRRRERRVRRAGEATRHVRTGRALPGGL